MIPSPPTDPSLDPRSDTDLLAAFIAREDGEQAFAEIVRRHAGLIYHAALRRTGDTGLAEEATQSAFALLARKAAALASHPSLSAWLHRTVFLLAGDAMARETAHRRRMKRYADSAALHAAGDDPLAPALPHLDRALLSLRESDRRLVLMRFHEGLSFQAMGERLRQPHDTARKATERAVARLGTALRRSGVTLSTAVLTSALSGILAPSAPAALMTNLSASSLASAGALSGKTVLLHTMHTMTAAQQTAAAAALVAFFALPVLGVQEWRHSRGGGVLPGQTAETLSAETAGLSPVAKSGATNPAAPVDILSLIRGLESAADPYAAAALVAGEIPGMDPALLPVCLETVRRMKTKGLRRAMSHSLYQLWVKNDPAAAAAAVVKEAESGYSDVVASVVDAWMESDPAAAVSWIRSVDADTQGRLFLDAYRALDRVDPKTLSYIMQSWDSKQQDFISMNFVNRNPELAWEIVKVQDPGEARTTQIEILGWKLEGRSAELLQWTQAHLEGEEKQKAIANTFQNWGKRDPEAALQWYQSQPAGTVPREALAGFAELPDAIYAGFRAQAPEAERVEWDFQRAEAQHGARAAASLRGLPEGERRAKLHRTRAEQWAEAEPVEASAWVDSLPPGKDRDQAAAGLTGMIESSDPQAALTWAASMGDPALRDRAAGSAWKAWLQKDAVTAWRWLRSAEIQPEIRTVIESLNHSPLR